MCSPPEGGEDQRRVLAAHPERAGEHGPGAIVRRGADDVVQRAVVVRLLPGWPSAGRGRCGTMKPPRWPPGRRPLRSRARARPSTLETGVRCQRAPSRRRSAGGLRRIAGARAGGVRVDGADRVRREARVVQRAAHAQLGGRAVGRRAVQIVRVLAGAEADDLGEDRRAARAGGGERLQHQGRAALGQREAAPLAIERAAGARGIVRAAVSGPAPGPAARRTRRGRTASPSSSRRRRRPRPRGRGGPGGTPRRSPASPPSRRSRSSGAGRRSRAPASRSERPPTSRRALPARRGRCRGPSSRRKPARAGARPDCASASAMGRRLISSSRSAGVERQASTSPAVVTGSPICTARGTRRMPERPAATPATSSAAVMPSGDSAPQPVTTTRWFDGAVIAPPRRR